MKTNEKKPTTPNKILDSALTLMLKEGFHGVSVDRIIALSGISKGTFFYHFKSKDELAERLLQRFTEDKGRLMNTLMEDEQSKGKPALETLLSFIEKLAPLYRDSTANSGCLIAAFSYQLLNEMPRLLKICQDTVIAWQDHFRPIIKQALNCSDQLAVEIARMMFCLLEGGFVVERIDQTHELEVQFKHLRRYIQLLANDSNTQNL